MRALRKPAQRPVSVSYSMPSPVGGWNARDSIFAMDEKDAVILQNWFPTPSKVVLRNGYTNYATGMSAQVETLAAYAGLTTNKLIAIAGTSMYDVTSGGAVGAAVQTGLTNARWQYINYENTSGNYLYLVNGADAPRYWDGTTWTNAAITGVTPANLIHINLHKNRIWFTEKDTLNAWYLGTSQIAGAATKFDLTGIATRGGYLMAMATWSIDAGYGIDDMAVFLTSKGEVIIYRGTDPSSATTWALVGVWQIGSPIGRRCFMKYRGDLLIITQDGVMPMAQALQSSRLDPRIAITDKIQFAVSEAVSAYSSSFGWQIIQFPKENMIILNVPVSTGGQLQFVMNSITGSWCQFSGWAANCWELFNDDIYFGGSGIVGKAWNGLTDNGSNIACDALQAFSWFKTPGIIKRFPLVRPIIQTDGTPMLLGALNIDGDTSDNTAPLSFTPTSYGVWDSAVWDSGIWGGGLNVSAVFQGTTGQGRSAGMRLKCASQGIQVQWLSTDFIFERGGIL